MTKRQLAERPLRDSQQPLADYTDGKEKRHHVTESWRTVCTEK